MKSRHKRIALIIGGLVILGLVVALVLNAFQSNLVFFFSPTQVVAGEAPKGKSFRIGGMVREGSIKREPDGVTLRFVMTDTENDMTVAYTGILPDLFKEGKGAVAQGRLRDDGIFIASEVLAKHDENYMPPEAAKAVGDAHERAAATKAASAAAAKTFKQQ
ncbi:cytochrome c maturation protein CcmE [Propionivibrio sp.]|uniref:cytochrome c maturation protein CcmE n=1 Tax=Propionivibrio sp. TaxID=2212460 RepID=UPI0026103AAE|nr:cytochrome c maturation protein CcmE [Propionivibrio sp.]